MGESEKFRLFMIQDDILTISIIKMYFQLYYKNETSFARLPEYQIDTFMFKQLLYEDIEKCFICRKNNSIEINNITANNINNNLNSIICNNNINNMM